MSLSTVATFMDMHVVQLVCLYFFACLRKDTLAELLKPAAQEKNDNIKMVKLHEEQRAF